MMKKIVLTLGMVIVLIAVVVIITPAEELFDLGVSVERRIAGLTLKTTNIGEGDISYLEGGSGPTLLLLHGFGANKDNWNRLANHLTANYHVVAPDLPGFGDSYKNMSANYDVRPQVERLNQFVEQLALKEFHIAGNSMGGYIAGNYAGQYSDKVISLWLLNTLGIASAPHSEMFENVRNNGRPVVLARTKADYEELITHVFHRPPYMPDFFIEVLAKQAEKNYTLHEKIFGDIHQVSDVDVIFSSPLQDALSQFEKPVLITWGDKDRILHPGGAKQLVSAIPNASVIMMEDIGHLPMIETPSVTAAQFIKFARR